MLGSGDGGLYRFYGAGDGNYNKNFTRVDSLYSDIYKKMISNFRSYHTRTAPAVADVDGDGFYEMVVGSTGIPEILYAIIVLRSVFGYWRK